MTLHVLVHRKVERFVHVYTYTQSRACDLHDPGHQYLAALRHRYGGLPASLPDGVLGGGGGRAMQPVTLPPMKNMPLVMNDYLRVRKY